MAKFVRNGNKVYIKAITDDQGDISILAAPKKENLSMDNSGGVLLMYIEKHSGKVFRYMTGEAGLASVGIKSNGQGQIEFSDY